MIVLGIETSCDETAISVIEAKEKATEGTDIKILANNVLSQIELHRQYGGVFPMMAKREHAKNLIPLLKKTLEESNFSELGIRNYELGMKEKIEKILDREPELLKQFLEFIPTVEKPKIDLISVTAGPGLEPCLWTGLNFAKALSMAWDIPVVAANHMEGHILISLLKRNEENSKHEIRNP